LKEEAGEGKKKQGVAHPLYRQEKKKSRTAPVRGGKGKEGDAMSRCRQRQAGTEEAPQITFAKRGGQGGQCQAKAMTKKKRSGCLGDFKDNASKRRGLRLSRKRGVSLCFQNQEERGGRKREGVNA